MGLDNFIETAMNKVLKNPIVEVLRDINFSSILKQSNFKKRDIGVKPYMIILQFLYMFIINKKIKQLQPYFFLTLLLYKLPHLLFLWFLIYLHFLSK